MFKKSRTTLQLLCLTLILFLFQNCSEPFDSKIGALMVEQSSIADAESIEIFSRTLQPTLRTNCAGCHGVSQVPRFAVASAASAFATIKEYDLVNLGNPAQSYFIQKISQGHNGLPVALAVTIQTNIEDWASELTDRANPVVDLTSPVAGVTASGTINLMATASDDVGVTGVQFYINNNPIGVGLTLSPYAIAFNTAAVVNGAYTISVRAYDAAGNFSEDVAAIMIDNVVVDTQVPTVSVTAPASGAAIKGTVNVTANAADNVGVQRVEFYVGTQMIAVADTTAPYSALLDTTTLTNASHNLSAKAYDAAGNMANSASIAVTVNNVPPDTQLPTVSVTAPAAGSTISGTVNVTANAADNVGVQRVEFYVGNQMISTADATAPYSVSFNTSMVVNGSHNLSARAYDAAGNMRTSAIVAVTVNNVVPDTQVPTVSVTAPATGSTVSGMVTVTANAADNVGVQRVEFYVGTQMIGTADTTAPYAMNLNTANLTNGSHTLSARAYDGVGNRGNSANVTVTVNNIPPDTQVPTVSLTAPANGSSISGTVTVTANAADNVGVQRVEFYVGNQLIGAADTTTPYSVSLNTTTLTNANHILTARAYDAAGNTRTSANVTVTVNNVAVNPNASFAWISANILVPRCISCHGASGADAGVRYHTYAETLKTVRVSTPDKSKLYSEVKSGSMPKSGSKLSAAQQAAILDWITMGAPNN